MAVLILVVILIIQAIILLYNMKLISGISYTVKDYISIIGIIILSAILFLTIESQAVLFLFFASLVFMYYKTNFLVLLPQ